MYYCNECKKECAVVPQDHGVEPTHHNWLIVSDCCEAGVEDEWGAYVSYYDWQADVDDERADRDYDEERDRRMMEDRENGDE